MTAVRRRGNEKFSHEYVEVVFPAGTTVVLGRGLAPRTFDTPLRARRCQWCGEVEGSRRYSRRCYGQPVKAGASVYLPVVA